MNDSRLHGAALATRQGVSMVKAIEKKSFKKLYSRIMVLFLAGTAGVLVLAGTSHAVTGKVKTRVEVDRGTLPADRIQTAVVKVTLDAPAPVQRARRPAVNLCIVLDRSGSMGGPKLARAKEAAIEALRRLDPEDIFSVVVYDHNVQTVVPAQKARHVERIEALIRSIRSGGNTALFGGVSQGAAQVRRNLGGDYIHRIILLSDGIANTGPSSPEDLGRLGAALLKERISVTTVGVGMDYNEDLMTRLSERSDGNTYFVESSQDLPRIFAAELGDVLNVVARKVKVTIECPGEVKPLRIIGRDGRIKGQRVELGLNQLYGNQEKYVLLELELPPGQEGRKMEIARVNVTYEDPVTNQFETASARGLAGFSRDKSKVADSANISVQKDVQLNYGAIAQEQAIDFADSGQTEQAYKELKKTAVKLKAFGTRHQDDEVLEKAEEMEVRAAEIKKQGMTPRSRKLLRTDSYQMKHQQKSK
ncbi:MAG: VWA domain-containing protein [Desulfobacterales bacterium]|nr:VWA domain-containing protein [Desulfobacterales bacterium]